MDLTASVIRAMTSRLVKLLSGGGGGGGSGQVGWQRLLLMTLIKHRREVSGCGAMISQSQYAARMPWSGQTTSCKHTGLNEEHLGFLIGNTECKITDLSLYSVQAKAPNKQEKKVHASNRWSIQRD